MGSPIPNYYRYIPPISLSWSNLLAAGICLAPNWISFPRPRKRRSSPTDLGAFFFLFPCPFFFSLSLFSRLSFLCESQSQVSDHPSPTLAISREFSFMPSFFFLLFDDISSLYKKGRNKRLVMMLSYQISSAFLP